MTSEVRKELNQATRLYRAKKREEAFEIYDKHFNEDPDSLKHWDKIRYCWTIYYMHIRDSFDEDELSEYAEIVTDIVEQEDLNESPVCVYTQCVFKVLVFYKREGDWYSVLYWLEKLNPELLSDEKSKSEDMTYPSKKEEYYNFKSKALLECGEYEECIEASKTALDTFTEFALNGDAWHKFRIAKSLRKLDESEEALQYLEEVVKVHDYWYVYKEFAENYCNLGDHENALKHASKGVLAADGSCDMKVNLYYLIFRLLEDSDPDFALKHAELFLAVKLEKGLDVPDDIEELEIDEESLDIETLEYEIKNRWIEEEFNN